MRTSTSDSSRDNTPETAISYIFHDLILVRQADSGAGGGRKPSDHRRFRENGHLSVQSSLVLLTFVDSLPNVGGSCGAIVMMTVKNKWLEWL